MIVPRRGGILGKSPVLCFVSLAFLVSGNSWSQIRVEDAPDQQPKKNDAMAIYFANLRPFEQVTLAKVPRIK